MASESAKAYENKAIECIAVAETIGQVRKPLDILAWTASFEDCTLRPT